MGDSHFSCLILRSIFALFTNPGDQYSSLESVGLYEKGANEQVVMDCFVWGGGGLNLRLGTNHDRLKMTLVDIYQQEIRRAVGSRLEPWSGRVKSPVVRKRKLVNARVCRETGNGGFQQICHCCNFWLISPRRTSHICRRRGNGWVKLNLQRKMMQPTKKGLTKQSDVMVIRHTTLTVEFPPRVNKAFFCKVTEKEIFTDTHIPHRFHFGQA